MRHDPATGCTPSGASLYSPQRCGWGDRPYGTVMQAPRRVPMPVRTDHLAGVVQGYLDRLRAAAADGAS
jgi:hypothetical protein